MLKTENQRAVFTMCALLLIALSLGYSEHGIYGIFATIGGVIATIILVAPILIWINKGQ